MSASIEAIKTLNRAKPSIDLIWLIYKFEQVQLISDQSKRRTSIFFPFLHNQLFSPRISSVLSSALQKSRHRQSVSKITCPYNIILEAEVDYDSEIGSEAWNIPLVIFPCFF